MQKVVRYQSKAEKIRPRSDFWREVEALLIAMGLKRKTRDLILKVRFGEQVELIG
jgi:hypothetical protein